MNFKLTLVIHTDRNLHDKRKIDGYNVYFKELPCVSGYGKTKQAARDNLFEMWNFRSFIIDYEFEAEIESDALKYGFKFSTEQLTLRLTS